MGDGRFVVTWESANLSEPLQTSATRYPSVHAALSRWEADMRARGFVVTPVGRVAFQAFGYELDGPGGERQTVRVTAWEVVREMTVTEAG